MLRADLKAAGIAFETAQGALDFHALRTTFCTAIGQSGASVETVRTLARDASITTTQRYLRTDDTAAGGASVGADHHTNRRAGSHGH